MLELLIAALLPAIVVILFTRVTYNKYVSFVLSLILMWALFDGLEQPLYLQAITVVSAIIGFVYSHKIEQKQKNRIKK
ncbi:DUF2198 family protein [Pseudalkalibacillus caeni]|uniref:DUF2198 family protein n=1 Tax=Exobacillus caeni TaxID=2574798 RepID=A0A5R9F7M0_9BACL|nr:DUF2198 family protein [Pseudalkalibacillus caeni]TLS38519.1 DUF2198 family protein [Pseudalkalibacillus caeni]